ncbi:uncharacterized protein KZ484_009906 [Pholidichthys leucotaenia]
MSQSHNPADSQALLQSMLQRLKLQPGREEQAHLHTPGPVTAASTWGQGEESRAASLQNSNNNPVNGFGVATNGVTSQELKISAADTCFDLKSDEKQPQNLGHSSPSQKNKTDGDLGENRVLGQATVSGINNADITSSDKTAGQMASVGNSVSTNVVSSMRQNQDWNQNFTPKAYTWSLKNDTDTREEDNKVSHFGNGGFGAMAQNKDVQLVSSNLITTNNSVRKKTRPSENKTRKWTQKIKERWRDRQGSFAKKGKEETAEQKWEFGPGVLPPDQVPAGENQINLISTSNKDAETNLSSVDNSGFIKTPSEDTEYSNSDRRLRSSSDFDFGLGSFSLLDEIVKDQEWAKFLNPTSANQRQTEEPLSQPKTQINSYDAQSSRMLNKPGGGENQWRFRSSESSSSTVFSMAQISPNAFSPVSMDISGVKLQQDVNRESGQPEPMEDSQHQLGQHLRPPSFIEPANTQLNSSLKSRVSLTRKRHHQPNENRAERLLTEKISDGEEAKREASTSFMSLTRQTGESQHDGIIPLYLTNSPHTPTSPSSSLPPRRGVLKQSISHDSESSMETLTKRRRVEENRRVRFAEEVMTIESPDQDMDSRVSEEDSEDEEEDSVTEREHELEEEVIDEVVPHRRHALPAWIRALKRKNTGRKRR